MDYKEKAFLIVTAILWSTLVLVYLLMRFTHKTFKTMKAFWVGVILTIITYGAVALIGKMENRGKKNEQPDNKVINQR